MTTFSQPDTGWSTIPMTGLAAAIATNVVSVVKHAGQHAPRSLQRSIGPSEIGQPCVRRLAYKLCDRPAINTGGDPWASIIGTSVHAWMEQTYEQENKRLGYARYVVERRLLIRKDDTGFKGDIRGSADLYDRDLKTNNDWKITGADRVKKYAKEGPGDQYRIQAHLYGLGQENAGESPEYVAITFLPRGGRIDGLHVWTEPYDRQVALAALERLDHIWTALLALDPPTNPQNWALFPTTPSFCHFCPWFAPGSTDASQGCPGA